MTKERNEIQGAVWPLTGFINSLSQFPHCKIGTRVPTCSRLQKYPQSFIPDIHTLCNVTLQPLPSSSEVYFSLIWSFWLALDNKMWWKWPCGSSKPESWEVLDASTLSQNITQLPCEQTRLVCSEMKWRQVIPLEAILDHSAPSQKASDHICKNEPSQGQKNHPAEPKPNY